MSCDLYLQRSLDVIPPGLGRLSFINPTNTSVLLGRVDNTTLNRTLSYAQVTCSRAWLTVRILHPSLPSPQTYQHPFLPAGEHTVCLWAGQEGGACEEYRVQLASGEVILFVVATNGTEPTQARSGVGVWGGRGGHSCTYTVCTLCVVFRCVAR